MTIHNCKFCQDQATYAPLNEMEVHGVKVFFCHECQAEYVVFPDGTVASTSLYTKINQKMYRWTVTSVGNGIIYHVVEPGIPGVKKNKLSMVKHFNSKDGQAIQNLTPQNVNDKLKTWLIFL